MLPIQFLESKYSFLPDDLFEIFMELRNIIATAKPDVTEELIRNSVTYNDSKKGGHVRAGVCAVVFCDSHIEVHFIHGTFLPDPQHLLQGKRKYKRFLQIDNFDSASWEAIKDLITASSQFDPYTQTFKAD